MFLDALSKVSTATISIPIASFQDEAERIITELGAFGFMATQWPINGWSKSKKQM